ncbi:MAG: sialate O-acetylesterase [Planctomycetes bacterium]|nr:sialate O-acetylesterase [Planctomycetota bacterium]
MTIRMNSCLVSLTLLICMMLPVGTVPAGAADQGNKLQVFVLAGQSNMEGQGVVSMDHPKYYNGGKGNLVWSMVHSASKEKMRHLRDANGQWIVRDDVEISFKAKGTVRKGALTVGYTGYGRSSHIGPELEFGHVMGDFFEEPVLLIKTAWGGKSLYKDFRPPSSGGEVGPYYTQMIQEIRDALKAIGDEEYEIRGFVWMQGWNDMCTQPAVPEYADNLVNLAKDIRREFKTPRLPIIIGELGNGGAAKPGSGMQKFRDAQRRGADSIENALFVRTQDFARPRELSPNIGHGHHWYGNAESYFLIGHALGEGMKKLLSVPDPQ